MKRAGETGFGWLQNIFRHAGSESSNLDKNNNNLGDREMRVIHGLVIAAIACGAGVTRGQDLGLDVIETDDLRLIYADPLQTYLVPHVVRNFQNSINFQRSVYDWQPWDKTTVVLLDLKDYVNAGAAAAPFNRLLVYIAPESRTYERTPASERMFWLMNHEMTHVANLDVWNQSDARWRKFVGGKPPPVTEHPESVLYNYLTVPRMLTPRWLLEGAAVFMETWMAGGIGRAQGAYDEMVFRTKVRDDAHFYSNLGIVSEGSSVDFQVGVNAYLYGARFISYLGLEYSPEQVVQWLRRDGDSKAYYSKQFEFVFGKPLDEAWDDWIAWERVFQRANLDRVREFPLTPTTPLVKEALGSISRSFYDAENNAMVGGFLFPGVVAHIGALSLDDGSHERIAEIKGPALFRVTSTAWDPATRTLFYTEDNDDWRDLLAVDMGTGKKRMLLKDARIGDIVFDPTDRSLWGLRHLNGYVTLVRIPYPYKEWNQVFTWPYGLVPYEIDLSPDGSMLSASVGEIDGDQFLRVFRTADLLDGKADHFTEYEFTPAVPEGFVFSPDGKFLYGSSFISGVSNIIRFEIGTGEIEAVSNAETGLFRPVPLDDGRLLVYEYTAEGFLPTLIDPVPVDDVSSIVFLGNEIAKKHPIVRDWNTVSSLREIDAEASIGASRDYRPHRELTWAGGYPIIEGYRDEIALGYSTRWQDPVGFNSLEVSTSYSWDSPADERVHFDAKYQGRYWWLQYWHNFADFYDIFGPTERARKGDAFIIGYDRPVIFDLPKQLDFYASTAYYTGLDTLPDNQNRPTFLFEDVLQATTGLHYSNTRRSLGAVDHETGWQWTLEGRVDHTDLDTIPKFRGELNFGFALPWKHASVWFYTHAGRANGHRIDPFANYYFGGFGNNDVDDGEVKRYRDYNSMPGFEIGELAGRDFGKITAEFNLPPIRFREVGTPGFYLQHIRPAIFATRLITDPGEFFERETTSAGAQLDLEFTFMHRLPMTLSVGWARGFEDGEQLNDEWMVSLKIL